MEFETSVKREIGRGMGVFFLVVFVLSLLALVPAAAFAALPQIEAGGSFSGVLKADGSRWAWGNNDSGQLGSGTEQTLSFPTRMGTDTDWADLVLGSFHALAIKGDGSLWAWGRNFEGQAGDGTTVSRLLPVRIGSDNDWIAVAAGAKHSLALKADGSLWAWGYNGSGQVGDGSTTNRNTPVRIGTDSDWGVVAAGGAFSLALKADGRLFAWGDNTFGQLGDGGTAEALEPLEVTAGHLWQQVAAGSQHVLGIDDAGNLWGWGYNAFGQLGDGTGGGAVFSPLPVAVNASGAWTAVAAGDFHSVAIDDLGRLWSWGDNSDGELGLGAALAGVGQYQVEPRQVGASSDWTAVAAGASHTLALEGGGAFYAFGSNQNGQLGDDLVAEHPEPLLVIPDLSDVTSTSLTVEDLVSPTNLDSQEVRGSVVAGAVDIYVETDTAASDGYAALSGSAWSYLVTGLVEGPNYLTLTVTDEGLNQWQTTVAITYDSVPPTVAITSAPATTGQATQTIFGTRESSTSVSLSVSGGGLVGEVTYPTDTTWLAPVTWGAEGTSTLTAVARDGAGNLSEPSVREVVYDATPPALTLAPVSSPTSSSAQVISGTRESGANVSVLVIAPGGGVSVVTPTYPDAGSWQAALSGLLVGANSILVTANDSAGNITNRTASIVYDITPPGSPVLSAATPTNDATPTWSWSSGGGGNGTYRYKLNDSDLSSGALETAALSVTSAALAEGAHTLYVQERDAAGNWSASASLTVEIDVTAPAAPVFAVNTPTKAATQTLWIIAEAGGSVTVETDTAASDGTAVFFGGNWVYEITGLVEGDNLVTVTVTDAAGNSASLAETIAYDSTPPGAPVLTAAAATNDTTPTWSWTSGGGGSGTFRYRLDDPDLAGGGVVTTALVFEAEAPLADGLHTFYVQERDQAGNWSESGSFAVRVDTVAPALSIDPPETPTNLGNPILAGSAEAGVSLAFGADTTATAGTFDLVGNRWSLPVTAMAEGSNNLTVTATDAAGNETVKMVEVLFDGIPPAAPAVSGTALTNSTAPNWSWSAGGGGEGTFRFKLDDGDLGSGATETALTTYTADALPDGEHTLYVQERDGVGNWSASGAFATTVDTVAPALGIDPVMSPTNLGLQALSGAVENGAAVSLSVDTAAIAGAVTVAGERWDSSVADLVEGDNLVTVTATDGAGNVSAETATIIYDVTPPASPAVNGADLTSDTTPTWNWSSGGDGIGTYRYKLDDSDFSVDSVETTVASFTPLNPLAEGVHALYVQERDAAGNWSATASHETDVDSFAPTLSIDPPLTPTNVDVQEIGGAVEADATLTVTVGGSAAVGLPVVSGGLWSVTLSALAEGDNLVTVSAEDAAGNIQNVTANIVLDTAAPGAPLVSGTALGNDPRPSWSWSGAVDGSGTYRYKLDDADLSSGATVTTAVTFAPTADLSDGTHVFYVQERDEAGNWSATGSFSAAVDTAAPALSIDPVATPVQGDNQTLSGDVELGATVTVSVDSAASLGAVSVAGGRWNVTVSALAEGSNTLRVTAVDTAGNTATSSATIVRDITAPGAPLVSGPVLSGDATPSWSWSSGGEGSGLYRYKLDDSDLSVAATETDGAIYTPAADLSDGSHTLYVQERDAAGNWSGSGSHAITIDTEAPALSVDGVASPTKVDSVDLAGDVEDGAAVTLTADTAASVGPVSVAGNRWSATVSGLVEGNNDLTVVASDPAGNTASVTASIDFDATAPTAPLVSSAALINDATPTWVWSPGGGGSGTFRYRLDDGEPVEVAATSFTPGAPLADGTYTLYVRERDVAGNWSLDGSFAVEVDTAAPLLDLDAPTTPTNNPAQQLQGDVEEGATVTVRADTAAVIGPVSVIGTRWSCDVSALASGSNIFTVSASDGAGNQSVATGTIRYDATPPASPLLGAVSPTRDATPTWSWSSAGGGSGTYRYKLDDPDLTVGATESTDNSFSPASDLADGTYTLYVQERDAAGNWSASASLPVVVDSVEPALAIDAVSTPTNRDSQILQGDVEAGAAVSVTVGGTAVVGTVLVADGRWNCTLHSLEEGENLATVSAIDAAGNLQDVVVSITYDATPPEAPAVSGPVLTNSVTPTWSWSSGGGGSGAYRYKLDDSDLSTGAAETATTSFAPGAALTPGSHTLYVQERDAAGNWSASGSLTLEIDTDLPALTIDEVLSPTNSDTQILDGDVEAGASVLVTVDSAATVGSVRLSAGRWETTLSGLVAGPNVVTVTATDPAGNTASAEATIHFDETAPAAPVLNGRTPTADTTPTWSWSSAGGGSGTYRYKLDDADLSSGATETEGTLYTPAAPLAPGGHTLYVQERDAAGNWSASGELAIEIDTAAPLLTIDAVISPSNLDSQLLAGDVEPGATVTVSADGGASVGSVTLSGTRWECPLSGLVEGANGVTVFASDPAGNSASAEATILYDVTAPDAPVLSGRTPTADITPTWGWSSAEGGSGIYRYRLDSDDLSGAAETVATSFTPAEPLAPGTYTLYVQERDAAGNWSASGELAIEVDTVLPLLTIDEAASPTNIDNQHLAGDVEAAATVTVTIAGGGSAAPVEVVDERWSCELSSLVEGENLVTVTAVDAAGNAVSAAVVIVYDATGPEAPSMSAATPTADSTPTWRWIPAAGGNGTFRYKLDDADLTTGALATTELFFTPGGPLADGEHVLYLQEADAAGNWSATASLAVIVDTLAPTLAIDPPKSPTNVDSQRLAGDVEEGTTLTAVLDTGATVGAVTTEGGRWSLDLSGLAAGDNQVTVTATDAASNTAVAVATIRYDATAPIAPRVSGPSRTVDTTPTWSWSSVSGGIGTYRYRLDDSDLSSGATITSALSYTPDTPLAEGSHTLYVQETDEAGNWSLPGAATAVVDLTVPRLTLDTLTPLTNTAGQVVGGEVEAGASVSLIFDTAARAGTVTVADGRWRAEVSSLQVGENRLTVSALDSAGNLASLTEILILDQAPPEAPEVSGPLRTSETKPQWSWGTTGGGIGLFRYKLDDGNLTVGAVETAETSFVPATALAAGLHTLYVQERDGAGNWSLSGTFAVEIDTAAPLLRIDPVASPTNRHTLVLGGDVEAGSSVAIFVDGGGSAAPAEVAGTRWSTLISGLAAGDNHITVIATDSVGNDATALVTIVRDLVAPLVPSVYGEPATRDTTPTWSWLGSGGGNGTFRYKLDDADLANGAVETTELSFTPSAPLPEAPHILYVQEQDSVGNWSGAGRQTIIVDLTSPTVAIDEVLSPTNSDIQTLSGIREGGATIEVAVDTGAAVGAVGYPGETTWQVEVAGLLEGPNNITAKATDAAGNSDWETVEIVLDSGAPAVEITSPRDGDVLAAATLGFTAEDGVVVVLLDGAPVSAVSGDPLAMADGSHTLEVQVTDAAGNTGSDAVSFVVDAQAPEVIADPVESPSNRTVQTLGGQIEAGGTIAVSVDTAAQVGEVLYPTGTTWRVTLSELAQGSNRVTLTATDVAGNTASKEVELFVAGVQAGMAKAQSRGTVLPLTQAFARAVLIAGPATSSETDPGTLRVRREKDSFVLWFQEWAYLDGTHLSEQAAYLILEEGRYCMDDGSIWEVGTFSLSGSEGAYRAQSFAEGFAVPPQVFLTLQGHDELEEPVTVRMRNVTEDGFEAALFEEEHHVAGHGEETVGYLAVYAPAPAGIMHFGALELPYLSQQVNVAEAPVPVLSERIFLQEEQSLDEEQTPQAEPAALLWVDGHLLAASQQAGQGDTAVLRLAESGKAGKLEWGSLVLTGSDWVSLPLAGSYDVPVVVVTPPASGSASVVQLRDVAAGSFSLRLVSWTGEDLSLATPVTVSYLVAEAGRQEVGGLSIEAGRLSSRQEVPQWEQVALGSDFGTSPPAVFAAVQDGDAAVVAATRLQQVTAGGFEIGLQTGRSATAPDQDQALGWIAIEQGIAQTDDGQSLLVTTASANDQGTEMVFAEKYAEAFALSGVSPMFALRYPKLSLMLGEKAYGQRFTGSVPVVLGGLASAYELDPASLRLRDLDAQGVELYVEEEPDAQGDAEHAIEDASVFIAQ